MPQYYLLVSDFVARNEVFGQAAAAFARIALAVHGDPSALLNAPAPDGDGRVSDAISRLMARTGEHVNLRRSAFVAVSQGVVASYLHNAVAPGLGTIGVLVAVESPANAHSLIDVGHQIAMHIAASAPRWISVQDIPSEVITEKRATLVDEARHTGKPPHIVEKMVDGRMRKFYEEMVLGRQRYVLNPEQTVAQALQDAEESVGAAIAVTAFERFRVGEGTR